MSTEILFVFALIGVVAALMASNRIRFDVAALLVVELGRYRFVDFLKVGVPLLLSTYLVTLLMTPVLFPFNTP